MIRFNEVKLFWSLQYSVFILYPDDHTPLPLLRFHWGKKAIILFLKTSCSSSNSRCVSFYPPEDHVLFITSLVNTKNKKNKKTKTNHHRVLILQHPDCSFSNSRFKLFSSNSQPVSIPFSHLPHHRIPKSFLGYSTTDRIDALGRIVQIQESMFLKWAFPGSHRCQYVCSYAYARTNPGMRQILISLQASKIASMARGRRSPFAEPVSGAIHHRVELMYWKESPRFRALWLVIPIIIVVIWDRCFMSGVGAGCFWNGAFRGRVDGGTSVHTYELIFECVKFQSLFGC